MDQSGSRLLLASNKFETKAREVLRERLLLHPKFISVTKRFTQESIGGLVELQGDASSQGGLMLYTSGTTNRPVSWRKQY